MWVLIVPSGRCIFGWSYTKPNILQRALFRMAGCILEQRKFPWGAQFAGEGDEKWMHDQERLDSLIIPKEGR